MTRTYAADYPTLGFDPTPGNVTAAREVAATTRTTAAALGQISDVLRGVGKGEWRGKAAQAFRDLMDDDFRPKVQNAAQAFDGAARALTSWVDTMDGFQDRARDLEQQAREAELRAQAAHDRFASTSVSTPAPEEDDAARLARERQQDQKDAAGDAAGAADAEVAALRRQARTLQSEYSAEGTVVAGQLAKAMDAAPNEPGFWDRLGDSISGALDKLGDAVADLGDGLKDFLHEIAPLLKVIGDIAGALGAVLGLMAFIPGLQFLAGPALILGGVALAAHYLSAVGESGSFVKALTDRDVILDAVGLVCGLGALKVGAKVLGAAKAAGQPVRVIPQLVGPAVEMPLNIFQAGTRTGYAMSGTEAAYRAVNLKFFQGGMAATAVGSPDNARAIRNVVTGDWGPMRAPRPAVTR